MVLWALVILAALCPRSARALDPNRAMSQYIHDKWGTEQGFPRGPVYSIAQTTDGYLWIGTEAGLVRFDGMNFRLVHDDSGSPITSVLGLLADNDGNLWIRSSGSSLFRYRDGIFDRPLLGLTGPITRVTAMSLGNRGSPVIAMEGTGDFAYSAGKFQMIAPAEGLPRSPVLAVAQTSDGETWIGTRDAGLFRSSRGLNRSVVRGLPDLKINCLLPDGARDLWAGTDAGVVRWDGRELRAGGIPLSLSNFQALALEKDRDGNLWIGTDSRGILRLNRQGVLNETVLASSQAITALFEDREGNLWIGSANELDRLRDSAFVTYSSSEGLPSDRNGPVYSDPDGRTWFAPFDGGLSWLQDGRQGRVTEAGLNSDIVYSIAGGKGELWIGRQRGGLTHLRSTAGSISTETYTQVGGLAQNSVYSVYRSRDGTIWAGTLSGGVSKFAGGRFSNYTSADGLASNTVASILETSDGAMWFGTPNGLSTLSGGRWQNYTSHDGLPEDSVNCLLQDSAGLLWIGTASGLAFRNTGRFQVPAGMPPSLREQILGMAEDKAGFLWISTATHVVRVKRDKLMRGNLADSDLREYGLADGLRGDEGVKRYRSVATDAQGRVWFSTNRGLSVVDPNRLMINAAPALVHIQAIFADGQPIDLRSPVKIQAGRQRLSLRYAGLSLSVPERVRFRYALEGFDHGWSEPVATREAVYTNLGPATYRFRVIASNGEGVWNSEPVTVEIEIRPALWQTWWFRVSSIALCVLSVVALYRLRLKQSSTRLNVRFEERLAERTRIARELHDTLLQGFLSASMQLHVAVDRLPPESPAKMRLDHILGLMRKVIEEGRNAVRGLRASGSLSLDLESAFSLIQQELAIQREVEFRVIVDGRPRTLHPAIRDEVYRIGREAVVNAFRHSGAGRIEVELEYAVLRFRVVVRDNGCGIDPSEWQSDRQGNRGLCGMRERADAIGARLHVWSRAANGTEVELSVPGRIAFQVQPSGRLLQWFRKYSRV